MPQRKSKNLTIINKNGKIILRYLYRINKKTVKRKTKKGISYNSFYLGYMPPEILDYFNFREDTLYFYAKKGEIRITSVTPTVKYQSIKVQKNNTYSIPRKCFSIVDPARREHIELTVDFSTPDDYMNGGTITIDLI